MLLPAKIEKMIVAMIIVIIAANRDSKLKVNLTQIVHRCLLALVRTRMHKVQAHLLHVLVIIRLAVSKVCVLLHLEIFHVLIRCLVLVLKMAAVVVQVKLALDLKVRVVNVQNAVAARVVAALVKVAHAHRSGRVSVVVKVAQVLALVHLLAHLQNLVLHLKELASRLLQQAHLMVVHRVAAVAVVQELQAHSVVKVVNLLRLVRIV